VTILPVAVALAMGAIAVVEMLAIAVTPVPGLVTLTKAICPLELAIPTAVGGVVFVETIVKGTSDPLTKPLPIGVGKITA